MNIAKLQASSTNNDG